MQNPNRKMHVGKSNAEKEAYKNFLSQRFKLDKTEEDEENPTKTDASSFDRDDLNESPKPQRKSIKLRVKDFFESNWTITIVGGLVVIMIVAAFNFVIKQGVHDEKISSLEHRTDTLEQKVDVISNNVSSVTGVVDLIKTQLQQNFDFLKSALNTKK